MYCLLLALSGLVPPVAAEIPYTITTHGHSRVDDYYWLNNIEDPAVMEYLEAENLYADSMMAGSDDLIETIVSELMERIPRNDSSVPYYRNGYWYWSEYLPDKDYSVDMRRLDPGGEPEVLFDENIYGEKYDYFNLELMSVSPDNRTLAWAFDTTGGHWDTLVFTDIHTGDTLDIVHNASGDLAWAADSRMVFYGLNDATGRTDRIMRQTIGCDDQVCVYTEDDPTFWPWISNSSDRKWILLGASSTLESEYRVLRSDAPRDTFELVHPRTYGLEYYIYPADSVFFIQTNLNGENFSIMSVAASSPEIENWRTVIPHDKNVLIEDIDIFSSLLAVSVRTGGLKKLYLADPVTGDGVYADLGGEASTFFTSANFSPDADSIRMVFTSLTTPWSTISYSFSTGTINMLKTNFAGDNFQQELYESSRVTATASDGTEVPIDLVYRKDLFAEGENPLLLYGYGAYGSSMDPMFSSSLLSLLDRGFVYAEAHVRGGSEMGRYWYDQGRTMNKMNTFTDFIACAEYLRDNSYCDPGNIFAMGESAGGLLMGAVTNMRPDLWKGVVAGVPFVDALTTMLDPSIPLTTNEYDEWGNPTESQEAYEYILSYSPVDNIREVEFPAMYVFSALNDAQVGYWEPAKWVAGIRRANTGDAPVIFRIKMGSGHSGASGRFGWLRDTASKYAFLLNQAGIQN
ncbi:MAG: S9 family peptidase [Candidatus Fermentibacteraceae bacterium]|nr:S9 family peptidase [Candidatus Fermentibacteraceae bacterium]